MPAITAISSFPFPTPDTAARTSRSQPPAGRTQPPGPRPRRTGSRRGPRGPPSSPGSDRCCRSSCSRRGRCRTAAHRTSASTRPHPSAHPCRPWRRTPPCCGRSCSGTSCRPACKHCSSYHYLPASRPAYLPFWGLLAFNP